MKVSVVVPCYNHARYVERCLASIDAQDHGDLEVIVVDDGSRDDSWARISAYRWREPHRVRLVRTENEGAHAAINRGLDLATGDWIAICNSDDRFAPRRISRLLARARQSSTRFAFSAVRVVDDGDADVTAVLPYAQRLRRMQEEIGCFPSVGFAILHTNVAVSTGNFFFERSLVTEIGYFRPYRHIHDLDFLLRVLLFTEPLFVPEPLYFYRLHAKNSLVESEADREWPEVMRRFMKAALSADHPNRLAPSPTNWPRHFANFVEEHRYQPYLARWEGIDGVVYRPPRTAVVTPVYASATSGNRSDRERFEPSRHPVRLIAFYLPQFHPIPENNRWWGPGFTEWTNVARARPLFPGHYQPRLPADLGLYDLRLPETRATQAELAREYGLEGFCYWHYWFAGKRLLERPFTEVLASGEPDLPFCLAWANQTWSGIWHGAPDRILIEQTYPGRADHEAHFRILLEAFADERYITVDGAPLFVVYGPRELPEARRVTDLWRELARKAGLPGLHLVGLSQSGALDPVEFGFDAVAISNHNKIMHLPSMNYRDVVARRVRAGYRKLRGRPVHVYRYEDALAHFLEEVPPHVTRYPCVIPGWDNTPRSGLRGVVLHDATPELFRRHVREALRQVAGYDREHRIVFVKSWNEWAEGNYLEPDQGHGRGFLEALREAVAEEEAGENRQGRRAGPSVLSVRGAPHG